MSLYLLIISYFNPRPREEGDNYSGKKTLLTIGISIHALVKRATTGTDTTANKHTDFNPRPREEGDFLSW